MQGEVTRNLLDKNINTKYMLQYNFNLQIHQKSGSIQDRKPILDNTITTYESLQITQFHFIKSDDPWRLFLADY